MTDGWMKYMKVDVPETKTVPHPNDAKRMTDQPDRHGWRSMESAPRDGTAVLLWAGSESCVIGFYETAKEWPDSPEPINDWIKGWITQGTYDCGADRIYGVTHWQPLPEAPEDS